MAIDWSQITLPGAAPGYNTGYTAPDPNSPGEYYYYGPDEQVYLDPYSGEVKPGDVSTNGIGSLSSLLSSMGASSAPSPFAGGTPVTAAGSSGSGSGTPGASSNAITPEYLMSLFNGQLPTESPSLIDPTQLIDQTTAGLNGLYGQQDAALTEALANAGITGGSTGGALAALGINQQTQELQDIAPFEMQADTANQSAIDAAQQYNIGNLINAGMYDTSTYNNFLGNENSMNNQDWLAQLGAFTQTNAPQGSGYQPIFNQPSGSSGFGGLAAYAPTSTPSTSSTPSYGGSQYQDPYSSSYTPPAYDYGGGYYSGGAT